MPRLSVVPQRGHAGLGHEHDVPAPAAVTPIGAAAGHVSLTAKRGGSSPAAAGGNEHPGMVDEHDPDDTVRTGPVGGTALG